MDRAHRALESVSEMIVRQQTEGASRLLFSPGSPIARPVLKGGAVLLSGAVVPDVGGGVVGRTVVVRLSKGTVDAVNIGGAKHKMSAFMLMAATE